MYLVVQYSRLLGLKKETIFHAKGNKFESGPHQTNRKQAKCQMFTIKSAHFDINWPSFVCKDE